MPAQRREILRLDPELCRIEAELEGRLPRQERGLLWIGHLGQGPGD